MELKQDILPVVLCDTNTAMPRDAIGSSRTMPRSRALPRITPQTFDYSQGSLALMRHCETIVRDGFAKTTGRTQHAARAAPQSGTALSLPGKIRRAIRPLEDEDWTRCSVCWTALRREAASSWISAADTGMATHWLAQITDQRTFFGVDYDENKIRVAQRTAPESKRIRFRVRRYT